MNSMPRKLSASWSYGMAIAPSLMKSHFSARCRHMGTYRGAVDIVMAALRHPLGESDGHALPDTTRRTAGVNSPCSLTSPAKAGRKLSDVAPLAFGLRPAAERLTVPGPAGCEPGNLNAQRAQQAGPTFRRRQGDVGYHPPPTCREKKAAP